jgi:hypothetical protein
MESMLKFWVQFLFLGKQGSEKLELDSGAGTHITGWDVGRKS